MIFFAGLIVFLLAAGVYVLNNEVPEHRASGRHTAATIGIIFSLGCFAAVLAVTWWRFGEMIMGAISG